jgi:hypothetical protein
MLSYSSPDLNNPDVFNRSCYKTTTHSRQLRLTTRCTLPTYRLRDACQLAGVPFTSPCMNKASCALSGPLFFSFLLHPAALLGVLAPLGVRCRRWVRQMLVSGAAGARSRDCTVQLAVVSTAAVMVALSAVSQALKYVYPAQGLWCMACKELTAVAASSKVPAEGTCCCWKG